MSEQPERPAQPGLETSVPKDAAAGLQAALDATFNQVAGRAPEEVEQALRSELDRHEVDAPQEWVAQAVATIADGTPVVAEPGDA